MSRYRKKPVVIDAWQFTKKNYKEGAPQFIRQAKSVELWSQYGGDVIGGEIKTLEGVMTISENDYIISFDLVLYKGKGVVREAIIECHKACDDFLEDVRLYLKAMDSKLCTEKYKFYDKIRKNGYKVAIVKQVAGQGAMYDNFILPASSSSVAGGRSIIDMGNMPIILSPNEYRDGAIRAMT